MTRYCNTYFLIGTVLDLLSQFICNRRIFLLCLFFFQFLLRKRCIFLRNCSLRHCNNRKSLSSFCTGIDCIDNGIQFIRDLRQKDNICAACNTGMKCYISHFMSHYLYDEYTAVRCCCGMDSVNRVGCNIHRTLESKRHIGSPEVIINRLRQCNYIQSLFSQKIGCLMSSVSAKYNKAVQIQLVIRMLHRFHFINAVRSGHSHQFKWLTGCSEDCSADCQNSREISGSQHFKVGIDQSLVTFLKSINLHIITL